MKNLKTTENLIFDTITNSAKRKFDYKSFEADFEGMPPHVAENFLFGVLAGFASGNSKSEISAKLFNQIMLSGFFMDVEELNIFLADKEDLFQIEIFVTQLALTMLENESDAFEVLKLVNKLLPI